MLTWAFATTQHSTEHECSSDYSSCAGGLRRMTAISEPKLEWTLVLAFQDDKHSEMRNNDEEQCRCDSFLPCVHWVTLLHWAGACMECKTLKHWMLVSITMMFWPLELLLGASTHPHNICENAVWSKLQQKTVKLKDYRVSWWIRGLKCWPCDHNIHSLNPNVTKVHSWTRTGDGAGYGRRLSPTYV